MFQVFLRGGRKKRMQYLLCVKGIGNNYENIIKVLNMYRVEAN